MAARLTVAVVALSVAVSAPAATRTSFDLRGAAIYANVCVERESDDQAGLLVIVRPASRRPRILSSYAEGALMQLKEAPSRERGGVLRFEVEGDIPDARFSGKVVGDHLVVRSHAAGAKSFPLYRRRVIDNWPYCP